jgi:hypothetical protein
MGLIALMSLVLVACRTSGLEFEKNDSLRMLTPRANSLVKLPVTLRWAPADLPRGGADGLSTYAVFVDRAPIGPGKTLKSVCEQGDLICRDTKGQPDQSYLEQRDVYLAPRNRLKLLAVTDHKNRYAGSKVIHEATVVMLNAAGERVGEESYSVEFRVADLGLE